MSHLTEDKLEEILSGSLPEPEHISQCQQCKERLAEKRAVANRLRSAFLSVKAGPEMVKDIREQLEDRHLSKTLKVPSKLWSSYLKRIAWPAAAAAVVLVAILLGSRVVGPEPVMAAQAELVQIHRHNVSGEHDFYSESDPERLADYFKKELGFTPLMPVTGRGMELRGCCVRHFRGRIVGSYVVDTPRGIMSVVAVTDEPESLGMNEKVLQEGTVFWKSSFAKNSMVSVRLGNYTYCAIGETRHDYLLELLRKLMPEELFSG